VLDGSTLLATSLDFEPVVSAPAAFAAVIRSELPEWQKVIAASGAKAD